MDKGGKKCREASRYRHPGYGIDVQHEYWVTIIPKVRLRKDMTRT